MSINVDKRFPIIDFWSSHLFSMAVRFRKINEVDWITVPVSISDFPMLQGYGMGLAGTNQYMSLYEVLIEKIAEVLQDNGVFFPAFSYYSTIQYNQETQKHRFIGGFDSFLLELSDLEVVCKVSGQERRAYEIDWTWLGFDPAYPTGKIQPAGSYTSTEPSGYPSDSAVLRFMPDENERFHEIATSESIYGIFCPKKLNYEIDFNKSLNILRTDNEYSLENSTRRYTGTVSTFDITYNMVPAAYVWRNKAGDIPSPGWKQASGRTVTSWSNVLETAYYWFIRADDEHPLGIHFGTQGVGGVIRPMQQTVPGFAQSLTPRQAQAYRLAYLDSTGDLNQFVEKQIENRLYKITLPFVDVTPHIDTLYTGPINTELNSGLQGGPAYIGLKPPKDGRYS